MDPPSFIHPEAANSLALALVVSSNAPLLQLDGDLLIIAASTSFCMEFEISPAGVAGQKLSGLGHVFLTAQIFSDDLQGASIFTNKSLQGRFLLSEWETGRWTTTR